VIPVNNYVIAGLKVTSDVAMPTATPSEIPFHASDVTIRIEPGPLAVADATYRDHQIEAAKQDFLFRAMEGLAFQIRNGREIIISRNGKVTDSDVALFLVGSAWGVLCHQRGLLPLHCSAIEVGNKAVAFTGPSGAGKSTLAAGFLQRGYRHLCDDVCIVDLSGKTVSVLPMPKGVKLWRDATDALTLERGPLISSIENLDKHYVAIPGTEIKEPRELSALYVLAEAGGTAPAIEPLRRADCFREVGASIYLCEWLCLLRDRLEIFKMVSDVAQRVRVFRFSRQRDISRFEQGMQMLEKHMERALANG
jgi:hypothetical protein